MNNTAYYQQMLNTFILIVLNNNTKGTRGLHGLLGCTQCSSIRWFSHVIFESPMTTTRRGGGLQ